jgi:hypothetical protein
VPKCLGAVHANNHRRAQPRRHIQMQTASLARHIFDAAYGAAFGQAQAAFHRQHCARTGPLAQFAKRALSLHCLALADHHENLVRLLRCQRGWHFAYWKYRTVHLAAARGLKGCKRRAGACWRRRSGPRRRSARDELRVYSKLAP